MHWHQRLERRWRIEQQIAHQYLRHCHCSIDRNGAAMIEGFFDVRSGHGHLYESVKIRVVYPAVFPSPGVPPDVYLLSHQDQWERDSECHINSDWSLCLFIPGKSGINFGEDKSQEHLLAVLHTFLIKQYFYQRALIRQQLTGERALWPGSARPHGLEGIAEAAREGHVRRDQPCLCGSGTAFKDCCMTTLRAKGYGRV